jgi:hypothetical protein
LRKPFTSLVDQVQESVELCAFCIGGASGTSGHAGVSQEAHEILPNVRSSVQVACVFCGAKWVRRRVRSKTFEWLRVAQ